MKIKTSLIGLFLIATMLFSTFAYAVIQSLSPAQSQTLPDTNIISYRLDSSVRGALIQYGATVVTFEYNLGCTNCENHKYSLEFLADEYKGQFFLEEVEDSSLLESRIIVSSLYGEKTLVGTNDTEIINTLCELMVAPPVSCALQKT